MALRRITQLPLDNAVTGPDVVPIVSDGATKRVTLATLKTFFQASGPTGPTGVGATGPTGAAGASVTGPTGAASTVPGPTGATGPAGSNATATTDASALVTGTLADARLPASVVQADENGYVVSHASIAFAGVGGSVLINADGVMFPDDGIQTTAFLGAAGQITSGTFTAARLPLATTSVRGAVIVGTGLGVSSGTVSVTYGTASGTACQGNDSRLSDARTPTDGSVTDAKITSGGLSASSINWVAIQPWAANTAYAKGDLVSNAGIAYRRSAAGTSGATFNVANWQQITPSEFVGSQITSGTVAVARLPTVLEQTVAGGNTGTAVTLSMASGSVQTWTLNGNCTFTMPTATAGASLTIFLTQGGTNTAAFTSVKWSGGTAPTITATANKIDVLVFVSDGTNWYGTALQNF